jgi:hypothetical protein
VRLLLVDVADPAAPRTLETLELDGSLRLGPASSTGRSAWSRAPRRT